MWGGGALGCWPAGLVRGDGYGSDLLRVCIDSWKAYRWFLTPGIEHSYGETVFAQACVCTNTHSCRDAGILGLPQIHHVIIGTMSFLVSQLYLYI